MIHFYWLLLLAAALTIPLVWLLGRRNWLWRFGLIPCLALLLFARLEISAYYKNLPQAAQAGAAKDASPWPELDARDESFLEAIRRPLLPLDDPLPGENWSAVLKARLAADFEQDRRLVTERFPDLTERESLIFYLTARVHGSMPTYLVRGCNPADLEVQLFAARGNCSDFAIRLMLAADLFGLATARISYWTPALPGHVLVEAYDPVEDTAWLLDANFNIVMFQRRPARPGGMLLQLLGMSEKQRKDFLADPGHIRAMPYRLWYADPGFGHFQGSALSTAAVNRPSEEILALYRKSFGEEISQTLEFSRKANQGHHPLTYTRLNLLLGSGNGVRAANEMDLAPLYALYGLDFDQPCTPSAAKPGPERSIRGLLECR